MQKILILEDDLVLADSLMSVLSGLDAEIHLTETVDGAFKMLEKDKYDLALLDRLLDDGDGIEVAEYLHDVSYPTKIIFLSTVGNLENRLKGLSAGADLYLPKPFSKKELLSLVNKSLHTKKLPVNQSLSLGPLSFSNKTGLVSTPQFSCRLRRKEAQILEYLIVRKNQTVTRDQIIAGVWGSSMKIPTYSTIDAYIRKIRVTLGDYSGLIKTIRGFGYSAVDDSSLKRHLN